MPIQIFPRLCVLSAVLMSLLPSCITAWGFEPLKGSHRCASTFLRLQGRDTDMETDFAIASYRFKIEHIFNNNQAAESLDFMRDRADALAIETFADYDLCGEDCEECDIPEEWKTPFNSKEGVDVMDFLGIKRAEPLL